MLVVDRQRKGESQVGDTTMDFTPLGLLVVVIGHLNEG